MSSKEELISAIETLNPHQVALMRGYLHQLKKEEKPKVKKERGTHYLRVQELLKGLSGSLAQDVIDEREDRV